jgi:RNA polymerase sigma-70 factor, ECF subfamily
MVGVPPTLQAVHDGPSDRALLGRLCAGEAAAFDELLQRHWPALVGYLRSIVDEPQTARDIAQETFVYLWRARDTLQPFGSVRTLLYRSARHLALNERRRERVRLRNDGNVRAVQSRLARAATPLELVERAELRQALQQAVDALPARRREVFVLGYVHGLPHAEIAEVMAISQQTVKNQMSSALGELRQRLAAFLE